MSGIIADSGRLVTAGLRKAMGRMRATKHLYDQISDRYDLDFGGVRAAARRQCVEQIARQIDSAHTVLDCAVGVGDILEEIRSQVRVEQFIGNDISPEMLKLATARVGGGFRGINGSAMEIEQHVESGSQCLVLSHLLYDYCDSTELLRIAYRLLRPGGYVSVMSTTKSQYDGYFWQQANRFPRILKLVDFRRKVEEGTTPESHAHHMALLENSGFEIVEQDSLKFPLTIHDGKEAWSALFESGWGLGSFSEYRPIELKLVRALLSALAAPGMGFYPYAFVGHISVVLGRKPMS